MDHMQRIRSFTNITNIQVLNDEPTADQQYALIVTTEVYTLYCK